jgi:hypothetical protein
MHPSRVMCFEQGLISCLCTFELEILSTYLFQLIDYIII